MEISTKRTDMSAESLPGETASKLVRSWTYNAESKRRQWRRSRRSYVPALQATVDADPAEWKYVVPQIGGESRSGGQNRTGFTGARVSWTASQVYFLVTVRDRIRATNQYRLDFSVEHSLYRSLELVLEPSVVGNSGSYRVLLSNEFRGRRTEAGDISVTFRTAGPYLEGVMHLTDDLTDSIAGVHEVVFAESGQENDDRLIYPAPSLLRRNSAQFFGSSRSRVLDGESLESWLER
jgi:hypothetical protein